MVEEQEVVAADVEVAVEVQVAPPVSWEAWAAGAVDVLSVCRLFAVSVFERLGSKPFAG